MTVRKKAAIILMCMLSIFIVAKANDNAEVFNCDFTDNTEELNQFSPCGFKNGIIYIKDSFGGKEKGDNALCISVADYKEELSGSYYTSKPFLLRNIYVNITESFVAECSIYSSEDEADSYVAMNINGIYTKIFELKNNGFISLGGTEKGIWQKGRWYHFAMEFDFSSLKADFYINGTLVLSDAPIREANGIITYFGGMKLCCDCETYGKQNYPVKNQAAFDNISLYKGSYKNNESVNTGCLQTDNGYFLINKSKSVSSVLSETGNSEAKVYTDSSLKTVAEVVTDGCVMVAFSESKKSVEYFTAADISLETDYEITGEVISIPEDTTAYPAKNAISAAEGTIIVFLDEKGKMLKDDDLIYDGYTLILQNESGYVRRYTISGAVKESELCSTVYTIVDDVISNVPKSTNSAYLINSLSADNPSIKIRLLENNKPVINKTITEEMVITALSNGIYKTYSIKTGTPCTFFENFENANGRFIQNDVWKVLDSFSDGVFFEAFTETSDNKALRMNTVSGINNYFRTGLFDYTNGIEIAFDFKIDSLKETELALMMFDSTKSANYIYFANVSNSEQRIKFFVGKNYAALDGLSDGWHSAKIRICADKRVYVFCDDVMIGELNSYLELSDGEKFDLSNSGVVFKAVGDGEFLIDNIAISDKVSLENANDSKLLSVYDTKMYIKDENGNFVITESIEKGEMIVSTGVWNNTDEDETVNVIVALMEDNSIADVYTSSEVNLSAGENKSVDIPIYVQKLGNNTSIKTFVWKSLSSLIPMKEEAWVKRNGIRIPVKAALENIFKETSSGIHPRIMARESDFNRIRECVSFDENISEWNDYVINCANLICENLTNDENDSSSPYYIAYTTEFNSNNQILEISRRVKNFIIDLAMAYQMTKDTKYSDAVWKIIQYVGLQETDMSPWGFPDWNDKNSILDTAEMVGGVAIGYDWCFEAFSDEQKKYIQDSIYSYSIAKFKNVRESYNANTVYNSCMIMAALSLADIDEYKESSINVLCNSLKNVQYSLSNWIFDGAWEEGSMYAVYVSEYAAKMISTLYSSLDSDFGISNAGGIEEALDYLLYIDGPTATNNYNDSSVKVHVKDASLLYFATFYNKPEYIKELLFRRKTYSSSMGALEMLWYKAGSELGKFSLPGSKYMQGNEVVTLSSADFQDRNRGWLSLQGGYSKNSHGHYDTGSFVYDCDNIRWIYDLGQESYSILHESGLGREQFYRVRPEGHNTYIINPNAESIGQNSDAYSKITAFSDKDEAAYAVLDMTQCYIDNATSAIRGYKLSENGNVMTVKDEIILKNPQSTLYWFLHLGDNVSAEQIDNNTVLLTKNNVRKILKTNCSSNFVMSVVKAQPLTVIDEEFICEDYPNLDTQNQNSNISKIMIKITGASDEVEIGASLIPQGYDGQIELLEKISSWQ